MKDFEPYKIQFTGLKIGKHEFDYHIDKTFFDLFDYDDFNAVNIDVFLCLEKKENLLELQFKLTGSVNVNCDVSNEPYNQPVKGALNLVVKFGESYNNDNDELLILPYGAYQLSVQQYIYEAIILAVPYKKIHPKVLDGTMNSAIIDKLEELSPDNHHKTKTDPRWDKLKNLLNEK